MRGVLRELLEGDTSWVDADDLGVTRRPAHVHKRPSVDVLDLKSADVRPRPHPSHHQVPVVHIAILPSAAKPS
jgi:hypothetical protein